MPDPSQIANESAMVRRVCVLMGMLGVFLQGSTGGHMLLVEHTRCAEHGELVHGDASHHHGSGDPADVNGPALSGIAEGSAEESHEHCALSVDRRDAQHRIADSPTVACLDQAGEAFEPRIAAPTTDPRRFRIAPKNSPPA